MVALAYAGLAGLQLAGGYFAAQNIKRVAELNNDIADMNAEFAELDAYDAAIQGETEQAKYQSIVDATLAEQTALFAATDVEIGYGSADAIQEETEFIAELNKMEIENQANAQALGYAREARQFRVGGFLGTLSASQEAAAVKFQAVAAAGKTGLTGYQRSR